jgi:hypothetical protein
MAEKPIKIERKDIPADIARALETPVKPEGAVVAGTRAAFDGKPSLKIDPSEIPDRISAEAIPTKRYHVGCTPNAPFTVMYCGNQDFPLVSSVRIPGSAEGRQEQVVERMGTVKPLTDEQVAAILKAAMLDAWRFQGSKGLKPGAPIPSRRWEHIPLGLDNDGKPRRKGAYFAPGDKLAAHFIYIRPLAEGEDIPYGVLDQEKNYLPIPSPLLVEEPKKSAVA